MQYVSYTARQSISTTNGKNELLLREPSQRTCKHQPSHLIFHTTVTDVTTMGTKGNKVFEKAVYLSVRVNYTLH